MVYVCCVPNCRGNYDESNKVSIFRFPQDEEMRKKWLLKIPREDYREDTKVEASMPVIVYLAGYCAHSALKHTTCTMCRDLLVRDKEMDCVTECNLIKLCDRGGLLYPTEFVINAVLHSYIVVQKLISVTYEDKFLKSDNQRNIALKVICNVLQNNDMLSNTGMCNDGHNIEASLNFILKSGINTLLNNYCKMKVDDHSKEKIRKN